MFIGAAALTLAGGTPAWWGRDWLPDRGLRNPCLAAELPQDLATHPVVLNALDGIDTGKIWDCHVHLVGTESSGPDHVWVNPALDSLWKPFQFVHERLYMNTACVDDTLFVERLDALFGAAPVGRPMLLAFDYNHDEKGRRRP